MENFITLKQLSNQITTIINQNFTSSYWVLMDIQKINLYRTGHAYPELVEKDERTNKIVAQMRGIIWSNDFLAIQRKFMQVMGTEMKDGIRVLAKCLVTYHPVYGLSLRILDIDTTYSQGILEQERLLTIKKLKEEGIYDANKKIPFPLVPQRIAIISIETSKGFNDFIGVLANNDYSYKYKYNLFPAILQGEKAIESILEQLRIISIKKDFYDVVVIVRGGGGEIGLTAYNDYSLAKAIVTFPLPVLTGIGHSTNQTVSDMVAHYSAITPTDLGYYIIDKTAEFENNLLNIADKLTNIISQQQKNYENRIKNLQFSILRNTSAQLYSYQSNLDKTINSFSNIINSNINKSSFNLVKIVHNLQNILKSKLEQSYNMLQKSYFNISNNSKIYINSINAKLYNNTLIIKHKTPFIIKNKQAQIEQIKNFIIFNIKQFMNESRTNIKETQKILELSDPKHILKMGYLIMKKDNKIITEDDVNVSDEVIIEGYKKLFQTEIKKVEKK
ncbi:MAG: exodeoxyribonuclease large subunit [Rikenellaceae bacterium]|jgi:exodeoxyribonuclease VII large subunit|nr:exodeoxyribonuclease large subunit [Rikenellaceae bacterium]